MNYSIYGFAVLTGAYLKKHPQVETRLLSSGQVLLFLQENDHKKVTEFHDQNVNVY